MSLAGTSAITELWAKCKAWFGNKLANTQDATTVTVQLKNNGDDVLSSTTIPTATPADGSNPHAGVMSAADKKKLDGIATGANNYSHPTTTAVAAAAKKVGNDANGHVVLGAALTASDVGAAASSHAHGNITSGGDITATAPTIASGDCLVINDDSASKITNGPSFGTDTTKYLRNDGGWEVPSGTYTHPTYAAITEGLRKIGRDSTGHVVSTSEIAKSDITALGIPGQDTTYSDATTSEHGLMSTADKTKLDYLRSSAVIPHATCSTAASTAAKVATLDNSDTFTLTAGAMVAVTFKYGNSNTAPTLNVNSTGAKTIATPSSSTAYLASGQGDALTGWGAYETLVFTYTGTYWVHNASAYLAYKAMTKLDDTPPKVHSSTSTTYGKGTSSNYGHVKLSDATDGTAAADSDGTAATPKAVKDALDAAKSYADALATGGTMFQGTASTNSTISDSSYKSGWYWVVDTAGTYVGQMCEVGDMVFAIANKGASYSASDFSVVQNNIVEMTAAEVDAICV